MNRILIRAWKKDQGTDVADRELVYVRAEKALYVGEEKIGKETEEKVKLLETECSSHNVRLNTVENMMSEKLTATPLGLLEKLPDDASLEDVVSSYNDLITTLKESGIMEK